MYDLVIIGGGPGGYVSAILGARQGLKVLLVEKDSLGGTCLNRGCIATKSMIYDSRLYRAVRTSPVLEGVNLLSISGEKMIQRKRQVVQGLVAGLDAIIRSNGIEVVKGNGELLGPGKVAVAHGRQSRREVQCRGVILATGSRPAVPPFIKVDGELVQTTDQALDTALVPKTAAIIGGGVIGIEMAAIYLNLDCAVTVIELLPDILPTEDEEVRKGMRMLLEQRGVKIFTGARAVGVKTDDKAHLIFEDQARQARQITVDRLLVATGRAPVWEESEARRVNLKMEGKFVRVNWARQTSLPEVYAIGDLIGGMMMAHKAASDGEVAVAAFMGKVREARQRHIPRCVWGVTEVGAVGLSEREAREAGRRVKVGKFSFGNSAAARALGHVHGFTKIVADEETGELLGVHILGEHATDLISEAVTVMNMEGAVEDLAQAVRPHPTLSETIQEAALDWSHAAIHSMAAMNRS